MSLEDFRPSLAPLALEPSAPGPPQGLPPAYGREKLVAVPRDSRWVWVYWELAPSKLAEIAQTAGVARPELHLVRAETRRPVQESRCALEVGSVWIQTLPGETYYAELGLASFGRPFRTLLRSQEFRMPWGASLHERTRSTLQLPEGLQHFKPPPRDKSA